MVLRYVGMHQSRTCSSRMTFIFGKASGQEAVTLRDILTVFASASGQCINFQKSAISFSRNIQPVVRDQVVGILGISIVDKHVIYLGFPSEVSGSKKQVFQYIKDRLKKVTFGWNAATLSKGGTEIMLKPVDSAIPTYTMSLARFLDYLCDELEKMMNSYWWGTTEAKKNTHWAWRKRMSIPKKL